MPEEQVFPQPAPQQQMSPEQIKELQEKIKQMSPEELKEFQKKQCIFCQIIDKKVQSRRVYEDEHVIAILDVNPANPGHILIMPREHYSIMPQIPDEEIGHIFLVTKALSNSSLRALEVQGSNIIVANGVAAGQRAQHFMVHLIPRKDKDGLDFQIPQKTIPEKELEKIGKMLSKSLGSKSETAEKVTPIEPLIKQEVVEADFEEKSTKKQVKPREKNKKIKPKSEKTKHQVTEKNDQSIDLDDIARVLGTK